MITCAECKWRVESHCRRYPPQLLRPLDGAFPSITPDWWCGEAAAKQPTEESNTTPYVPAKSLGQVMREWDEMPDAKPKTLCEVFQEEARREANKETKKP